MKAGRIVFALALIAQFALSGSEMTLAQSPSSEASVSETSSETERLILPASQEIALAFKSKLSSQKTKLGDVIEFVVARDVKIDGLTVIAVGSIGHGKVTATKRRGHIGKPGSLEVEFSEVPSVDGTPIGLKGKHKVSGEDRREQVKNEAADVGIQMLGFGSMFIPAVLLKTGGKAEVQAGTRFNAAVANDALLEKASIERNQPKVSPDNATIFIIRGNYLTCGSLLLIPANRWSHVVRMEVPEGRYWFRAGVPKNGARDFTGGLLFALTMTAVPIDWLDNPAGENLLNRPVDEFFPLDVQNGQTYYISGIFPGYQHKVNIRLTEAADEEDVLDSINNQFFYVRDLPPEVVQRLQAEPKRIHQK
jgi:hypothetical protein